MTLDSSYLEQQENQVSLKTDLTFGTLKSRTQNLTKCA